MRFILVHYRGVVNKKNDKKLYNFDAVREKKILLDFKIFMLQ